MGARVYRLGAVYVRWAVYAGRYYPGSREELRVAIEQAFTSVEGPGRLPEVGSYGGVRVYGVVSPHAPYRIAGPVYAHAYYRLAGNPEPDTVIVVGPDHYGVTDVPAVGVGMVWNTPLGSLETDDDVGEIVLSRCRFCRRSAEAFASEHSIEAQLPWIQYLYGDSVRIVPIIVPYAKPSFVRALAKSIVSAVRATGKRVYVVGTTDMSHYTNCNEAKRLDHVAIELLRRFSWETLVDYASSSGLSWCGVGAAAVAAYASWKLGAERGVLYRYVLKKYDGECNGYGALGFEA